MGLKDHAPIDRTAGDQNDQTSPKSDVITVKLEGEGPPSPPRALSPFNYSDSSKKGLIALGNQMNVA